MSFLGLYLPDAEGATSLDWSCPCFSGRKDVSSPSASGEGNHALHHHYGPYWMVHDLENRRIGLINSTRDFSFILLFRV